MREVIELAEWNDKPAGPSLPRRVARRFVREARQRLSLSARRTMRRDILLPVRNALLRRKPIRFFVGGVSAMLLPTGAAAADCWSGLWFEQRELEFILKVLEPGMTFFDVGANAGIFSLVSAARIGAESVWAFEPCAETYQLLLQNILLNGLEGLNAIHTALGDYRGDAVLQVNRDGKDGLNTVGQPSHPDCEIVRHELTPMITLDAFVQENAVQRIDAMKLDAEGAELPILRGGERQFARSDAPLILFESYGFNTKGFGYHPVEIRWFLRNCGYELFQLDTKSGVIRTRSPHTGYDGMGIAVKTTHPSYSKIQETLQ